MIYPKLIDHHMHTNYSPDADPNATMLAYINQAKRNNVSGIMFTDHVDFDTPIQIFADQINYDEYLEEINRLRIETSYPIYMGVEIGYQLHLKRDYDDFLSKYPFDFVICSIHVGDNLDFYNRDFFKGKTQHEAYLRYFEIVLETVKTYDNYDVFGHIDYIIRYGGFDFRNYNFKVYEPIINEILKTIISKGKGIEINTSGIRYNLGVTHPKIELLKRYRELGGKIITIGSDAHRVSDYQADFTLALSLLREAGFDQVCLFKQRKIEWIDISSII